MPIIEHHQKVWRKKQRKGKRVGGFSSSSAHSTSRAYVGAPLPELGKRLEREDEGLVARLGGRSRLLEISEMVCSLVEVDLVQPRRQQ